MPKRIQFRRDIAANWTLHNPRLMPGEIGMETDTQKYKIGDGVLDWEDLPYYLSLAAMEEGLEGLADEVVAEATVLAEGYKDAAAGSAAAAATSATEAAASAADAASSATDAETAQAAAEAAAAPTDALVAGLVANPASATNDAIEVLIGGTPVSIPAMNNTARNALTPSTGTTIYNTTHETIELYNGTYWVHMLGGSIEHVGDTDYDTKGASLVTGGGSIDLNPGGKITGGMAQTGIVERNNFAGSPIFDFTDGMGGASSGFGTMPANCGNVTVTGSAGGFDAGDAWYGITLNTPGLYLWTMKLVLKRNGGSPPNVEIYLRKDDSGTRTGGTGVYSVNAYYPRVDNIFAEQTFSRMFNHTGTHDYHVILTAATSASNLTSMGYGTGWQLLKLGEA